MSIVPGVKITSLMSSAANGDTYGDAERKIFRGIQTLVMPNIISATLNAPPVVVSALTNGQTYIVGTAPTGLWAGQANAIAYAAFDSQDGVATTGIWEFYTPQVGWTTFNQATSTEITWNGTAWAAGIPLTGPPNSILSVSPSAGPVETQLLTAATYAVLAFSGVTNTGSSVVSGGNLGSYSTNTFTQGALTFVPPAAYVTASAQNQTDLAAAIVYYQGLGPGTVIPVALDAQTLTPGVYSAGTFTLSGGTLTLNGAGVYVFLSAATITLTGASQIVLTGGATAANVVFVCQSSFTAAANSGTLFNGNILAHTSITLNGGTYNGRALANTGAVTISSATNITVPAPAGAGVISFTSNPTVTSLVTTGILTVGGSLTSSTNLTVNGTLTDGSASVGTAGQVLTSTGTHVVWGTAGSASSLKLSPLNLLAASGAIPFTPSTSPAATYIITLGSAAALTLVAPTATVDDGKVLIVQSNTPFAHTITATGLFNSGTSGAINLATFNNSAGATIVMMAYQEFWNVISLNGVVIT